MLTFYYANNTARSLRISRLKRRALTTRTRWIDFGAAEHETGLSLKVNPKQVPSLMTERGVVTETPAILPISRRRIRRLSSRRSTTRSPSLNCSLS